MKRSRRRGARAGQTRPFVVSTPNIASETKYRFELAPRGRSVPVTVCNGSLLSSVSFKAA